jgi:O-antigen ligase
MAKHKIAAQQKQALTSKHTSHDSNTMMIWIAFFAAIISVALSFVTVEPTISVRYMLTGLFCLGFSAYFFVAKKYTVPGDFPLLIKLVFGFGILYFVWNAIALNFAINPAAGYYELTRQLLNLLLLFILMEAVRREVVHILIVAKVIVVISIIHSIIGILQFYGVGFLNIPGANAQPYGLMANRNLYGSAQAFTIPFVLYVWISANSSWKKIALIALAFLTLSILLSQTRSAWLASAVILFSAFVLVNVFLKESRKQFLKWSVIGFAAVVIIVIVTLFINKQTGVENTITERALSFTTGSNKGTESAENVNARFKIWKKTVEVIKDKPFFGTGLSNWKLTVVAYGAEDMPWKVGDFIPDRPHNVYLQVMAESGMPGFIFYIAVWVFIVIIGFKTLSKPIPLNDKILLCLMLGGIAGFATDCMFSFPMERLEHSFYLLLMCGIIMGIYLRSIPETELKLRIMTSPVKWLMIIIGLLNVFIAYQKYIFEASMNKAQALETEGNFAEEIDMANSGKSALITIDPEGHAMEMRTGIAYKGLRNYDMALKEMQKAKKYNPYSPMLMSNIGSVYTDMKDYKTAVSYYQQALKYAPDFQVALINLAANQYELGNYQATMDALAKVDFKKYPKVLELQNLAKRKLLEIK